MQCLGPFRGNLQRRVEYYQWVEHSRSTSEDKFGGKEVTTTTYTYSKEWVSKPVDSEAFKDSAFTGKNYVVANYEDQGQWAENVTFGAYKLNESLTHMIMSREAVVLNLDPKGLADIDKSVAAIYAKNKAPQPAPTQPAVTKDSASVAKDSAVVAKDSVTVVPDSVPQENKVDLDYVHQAGNVLFLGKDTSSPEIGDVRITFEKVVPATVTIVAQVNGDTLMTRGRPSAPRPRTSSCIETTSTPSLSGLTISSTARRMPTRFLSQSIGPTICGSGCSAS